ncbi:MAG: M4 family metallopeptidase [Vicinamibacterales bacterium]
MPIRLPLPVGCVRRDVARLLALLSILTLSAAPAFPQAVFTFEGGGHTEHGDWTAAVRMAPARWLPGVPVELDVELRLEETHLSSLRQAGIAATRLCLLVTAERTFDAGGWMRLASDERMSTLLTPTGLAIEGGVQGALTPRFGYAFKSPLDMLLNAAPAASATDDDEAGIMPVRFTGSTKLPGDLPPGLYRLRLDFGVVAGTRRYNINGYSFAVRPGTDETGTTTYFYSPIIEASGADVSGRMVDASAIQPRCPWLLLANYNSNGYRGVVADEDRHRFATSDRSIIPDEVILPMYDSNGARVAYSLEPQFPFDTIDPRQNIQWNWASGRWSVQVRGPDGSVVDLGAAPFVAKSGNGPTTKNSAFTQWRPQAYGQYTVTASGWIQDQAGRRYDGGGTYRFWIAKRMTLATATFQGQPYPVGSRYGRDIQFNPAFPARVRVKADLYVNSSATNVRSLTYEGVASPAGIFGAAQGMQPFPLDAPGEYHAHVLATYTDSEGHLWVCTMRHAGIVYSEARPVVARGKKFAVKGKYVERGETNFEGYVGPDGDQHLAHITFPYQAGDMLLIGSEGQGANKIEPVLTYQMKGDTSAWDTKLNGVGTTNLRIQTSNGYSPHLFPEYITDIEYYYAAAPRPGFMGRFLVGESNVRAPYWPVSPNSFGGQIAASPNGDAPGDIYRLLGGIVLRRVGQEPMYAGYIASAFLLPKGSNNNRVVAAGSEDLHGPTGEKARFFLVGLRPGTAYELGSTFRPVAQIDPILPVSVRFVLTYPDGRQQVATGTGDAFGNFAGASVWPLDVCGVYRYQLRATWNGHEGRMPGLPDEGGVFYVYSPTRPAGAAGLRVEGATQRTFSATTGATITGTTTAGRVHYALLTPGAVIEQGEIPVSGGRFQYRLDPAAVNARAPIYDIVSITTGKPQIGRVLHLTFFAEEQGPGGRFFDVARVILRGTTLLSSRALLPAVMTAMPTSGGLGAGSGVGPGPGGAGLGAGLDAWVAARLGAGVGGSSGGGAQASGVTGAADVHPSARASASAAQRSMALTVAATDPESLREWDARVERMVREGTLRAESLERDTTLPGRAHERLRQFHEGVPVFGAGLARQVDKGVAVSILGLLHLEIDLDVEPVVTPERAASIATSRSPGAAGIAARPELVVLQLDAGGYALAWQTEVRTGTDARMVFVDAKTGRIVLDYSNLRREGGPLAGASRSAMPAPRAVAAEAQDGGGAGAGGATGAGRAAGDVKVVDFGGDVARAMAVLRGSASRDRLGEAGAAASAGSDAVVSAARDHAAAALAYLRSFGRDGLDGRGSGATVAVHPVDREAWPRLSSSHRHFFAGGFWDGRMAVMGEGLPSGVALDGRYWDNAALAFDLVAHELAHGVVDSSSRLINRGESGALGEAFADIIAAGAEMSMRNRASEPGLGAYAIGEGAVSGGGLRSLEDPGAMGHPDHFGGYGASDADDGGVHFNSTIVSHAWYLAIEGGRNRTSGLAVEGVGDANRQQVERAFYRAFVYMLPPGATFSLARAATIQSAADLYGPDSSAARAIRQAWIAVGVR